MRTRVVTTCDRRRARDVTGKYPDRVQVITNRSIGERLCRSEEMEGRYNKKPMLVRKTTMHGTRDEALVTICLRNSCSAS